MTALWFGLAWVLMWLGAFLLVGSLAFTAVYLAAIHIAFLSRCLARIGRAMR